MQPSFAAGPQGPDIPAVATDTETTGRFHHEALLYSGTDDFVARVGAFVREGIERREPTLVMVGAEKLAALRDDLGPVADDVRFEDMGVVGRNPARIIPAWRDFARDHSDASRLRGVGEPIWAGRSADELVECQRHEMLLNLAFDDAHGFNLICPYDTAALDHDVLAKARESHPCVGGAHGRHVSTGYSGLAAARAPVAVPLPPPPADAAELPFAEGSLTGVRTFVEWQAEHAGLGDRGYDLVVAVNELASNSLRHGGGTGMLRTWRTDGALVCEVEDAGRIDDPLVGRVRPERPRAGGLGVWIVNQLCDLVQIRAVPGGTVVRAHMGTG